MNPLHFAPDGRPYTMADYEAAVARAKAYDWREKQTKPTQFAGSPYKSMEHWKDIWLKDQVTLDGDQFTWNRKTHEWRWNHTAAILELIDLEAGNKDYGQNA